jgi:hypothetical protein
VTSQDQQVLRVAVHAGSDAIHPEQDGPPLLVAFRLLQDIYQPHLALDQGLASVGEVHEHGVELAAKASLAAS